MLAAVTAARWPPARCGCDVAVGDDTVNVVVGYQSKTINTVTAGTLLRAKGFLEKRLDDAPRPGTTYKVQWQDYDTGAPITAQMTAEKIDIGSMGDYPLLINGSKTQANERAPHRAGLRHRLQPDRRAQHGRRPARLAPSARSPTSRARRSPPASAPPATARWSAR